MFQLTRRPRPAPANGRITRAVRRLGILLTACALALAHAAPLLAQAQKTAPAEPAAEGGSWPILDWLIVAVLICAAIYVICRSSRRN
jgi:hypothetical protein